jgi:transposase
LARKGQRFQFFDPEFKRRAVEMYLSGMSKLGVTRELGLPNDSYVRRWIKAYEYRGWEGLSDHRGRGRQGAINLGKTRSQKPELKIKWIEAEIDMLKKIQAWERRYVRRRYCFPLS